MSSDNIRANEKWQGVIEKFKQYWHGLIDREEACKLENIHRKLEKILEKNYHYQYMEDEDKDTQEKFDIESFFKSNQWGK